MIRSKKGSDSDDIDYDSKICSGLATITNISEINGISKPHPTRECQQKPITTLRDELQAEIAEL